MACPRPQRFAGRCHCHWHCGGGCECVWRDGGLRALGRRRWKLCLVPCAWRDGLGWQPLRRSRTRTILRNCDTSARGTGCILHRAGGRLRIAILHMA